MPDDFAPVEASSASTLSPKSQRILLIVVYVLPLLWIADHAWQREQVSTGQTALSKEKSANAGLLNNNRDLQRKAILLSSVQGLSQIDELRNAGVFVRIEATDVIFGEKLLTSSDEMIEELSHLPFLRTLTIRSPGLSSVALQPIPKMRMLQCLFLTGDCLENADKEVLQILNGLPVLQSIELANAALGDDVFRQLAQKETLRLISLRESAVEDRHIKILAECKRLETLYLLDTLITDQCIPYLCKMTHLKELTLPPSISPEAADQLSESTPDCFVYLHGKRVGRTIESRK